MTDIWDKMVDWRLVLPPSRPSISQLSIISAIMESVPEDAPIAILGSTLEYRTLVHRKKYKNVCIFERNKTFYELTTELLPFEPVETVIWGDWRDTLRRHSNCFTLILSDLTSGNIPYTDQARFYKDIAKSLRPDGYFCDKVLTFPAGFVGLEDIFLKYEPLYPNLLTLNYFSCEALFCSEVLSTKEVLDTTIAYSQLQEFSAAEWWQKLVHDTTAITPTGGLWYYGKRWDDLVDLYFQPLQLVESRDDFPGSPYHGRAKVLISTKQL